MNTLSLFDGISCARMAQERAGIKVDRYFCSEIDKFAIKVAKNNYPNSIYLGDINSYKEWNLPRIDLLIGGSPCFARGTYIVTQRGYTPIESVVVGDYVLTHNNNWKRVMRVGGQHSLTININARGILGIETTQNHPFYVVTRNKCKNRVGGYYNFSDPYWKNAGDIVSGDYVAIPIEKSNYNKYDLTDEECYILGRYIADGHTRKDRKKSGRRHWQLILSIGSHKIPSIMVRHSLYRHSKNTHRMIFSSKRLVEIAEKECGSGALNKKISPVLLKLPKRKLEILLNGLMDGDGNIRDTGEIRLTTISKVLVDSITLVVAKLYGVATSVLYTVRPKKKIIEGRIVSQRDTYTVSYRKEIRKQSRFYVDNNHIWVPFKGKSTGSLKEVFNIEVEGDNSYVANNFVVHNCQGFSSSGKGLNFEDPRSKLFFKFVEVLESVNPRFFILENVKMKKEWQDVISTTLGVEPIEINSSLVSAQNRKRLYWCNFPVLSQPEDRGILLEDIIENGYVDRDKSHCIDANYHKGGNLHQYMNKSRRQLVFNSGIKIVGVDKNISRESSARIYSIQGKSPTLNTCQGGGRIPKIAISYFKDNELVYVNSKFTPTENMGISSLTGKNKSGEYQRSKRILVPRKDNKCNSLSKMPNEQHIISDGIGYRMLTRRECERLQTVTDGHTDCVSKSQAMKCLGNGFTVDVIVHLLMQIKDQLEYRQDVFDF